MPIYFFWGEDEYRLTQAMTALRSKVVDPLWREFNEDIIPGDKAEAETEALAQALTPPFGAGGRFICVMQTSLGQRCSNELLAELERTLPKLPETSHLLFTSDKKLDGRLKSTKLLKQYAVIKEFAVIPPWKTEALLAQVEAVAKEKGVALTTPAQERLAEAVGNNTRLLSQELEKLSIYAVGQKTALDESAIAQLVSGSTHNSLQLARAIAQGNTHQSLPLVTDLLNRNEPALKIVAVLVGQFRTWFWIKLKLEQGERDNKVIAKAAEINNPKRVYFLQQDVRSTSVQQFLEALPILLNLEAKLKRGEPSEMSLQIYIIQLCQIFQRSKD